MFIYLIDSTESEFNLFLKQYGLYFAIGFAVLLILVLLIFLISHNKHKTNVISEPTINNDEVFIALGGKDNIIEHNQIGSRLSLKLNNYELVDTQKLNELGFPSVIRMSNKITLVYEGDLEELCKRLFN